MIKIDKSQVEQVIWEQDPDTYDQRLHALGSAHDEFVIVNPKYEWILDYVDVDNISSDKCIVWSVNNLWLIKKFKSTWTAAKGWNFINCKLDLEKEITINPEVDFIDYNIDFTIAIEDMYYEHIYYLDQKHNPSNDKIWVAKCRIKDQELQGTKDRGYVSPIINLIRNPAIPDLEYNLNLNIPYYDFKYNLTWYLDPAFNPTDDKVWALRINSLDKHAGVKDLGNVTPQVERKPIELIFNTDIPNVEIVNFDQTAFTFDTTQTINYEHVWYLDPRFNPFDEQIWVAKVKPTFDNPVGTKDMGYLSPKIVRNPAIPDVDFEFKGIVPYYELKNDLIWYLDSRFNPTEDNIWAIKILTNESEPGLKDMGLACPKIILNPDVPRLDYYINDRIPYYDLGYEHVWMLDRNLHSDKEEIWAAKIVPNCEPLGTKLMGNIVVVSKDFDVVFISYKEPNAEANWYRLLELFPNALRVKNVKGIFEAHKRAAEIATTDMFYVVDGDAEILDSWKFDFRPDVFDMDCVHLWTSLNPINDLEYGYGGVKLFPRQLLLDATTWRVDLTTGLGKLKFHDKVSNITGFNTDPFGTWRSAFRECAKLSSSLQIEYNKETEDRLTIWTTQGQDRQYGEYALHGARSGKQYGADNCNNLEALKQINNYEWMKNEFDKFYKQH